MKTLLLTAVFLISFNAAAETVTSTRENLIRVARVVKIINLVDKTDIKVNLVVEDLGGSTDVSPTQRAWFTLYSKGEMYSTDASFMIGEVFEVFSARRISGGIYEVSALVPSRVGSIPTSSTIRIDAARVITQLKNVSCEDFGCEASDNFSGTIELSRK